MPKYRNLPYGGPLPASWLAAIQEFIGIADVNLHLSLPDDHSVQIVAGANSAQVSLGIDGLWRYISSSTAAAAITGGAGLFDVFAVTGPNIFAGGGADIDTTDYTFSLEVLAHGATPVLTGGLTNYRKIGELDWDGTKIIGVRQLSGELIATSPTTPTAPVPTVVPIRAIGAASQSAPLQTWEAASGTIVAKVSPTGTPAADDNSISLATTAFVVGQLGFAPALPLGSAAPGTSSRIARADHVHPAILTPLSNPIALTAGAFAVGAPSMNYLLPAGVPADTMVGVKANSGVRATVPVTITAPTGTIITGPGMFPFVNYIQLGQPFAFVVFLFDGNEWHVMSGEQDTGWLPFIIPTGFSPWNFSPPMVRKKGDALLFKGGFVYNFASPAWLPVINYPVGAILGSTTQEGSVKILDLIQASRLSTVIVTSSYIAASGSSSYIGMIPGEILILDGLVVYSNS